MTRSISGGSMSVIAALLTLLLASCAGLPARNSDEERVAERAKARWEHLLAGQWARAYEFLSPGQRSAVSLENYQRRMLLSKVRYVSAKVDGVECEGDTCSVAVKLEVSLVSPVPGVKNYEIERPVEESWIRVEKQWWYVPK